MGEGVMMAEQNSICMDDTEIRKVKAEVINMRLAT